MLHLDSRLECSSTQQLSRSVWLPNPWTAHFSNVTRPYLLSSHALIILARHLLQLPVLPGLLNCAAKLRQEEAALIVVTL